MKTTEYNIVKTIKLINKEPLLNEIFKSDYPDFNHINYKAKAEKGTLGKDVEDSIEEIFTSIIKNREEFLSEYETIEVVEATPRRYGKVQIEKELKEQDGIANDLQLMMLDVNDIKSMQINLVGKGTSDRYKGTEKLSNADIKIIRAAILTFKKKVLPITKKR